jgi:hypothetical protein
MEKIDRLGWAAGFSFESFGVRVGVRLSDAAAAERVRAQLPPGWKRVRTGVVSRLYSVWLPAPAAAPNIRRLSLVYENARRVARTADASVALDALGSAVRLYVAERAPARIFVHAGVVAWNGRAILVPGRSHSGKSRLVEALVRAGAVYYSDEYAVLDGRGRVHAFPAPLKLRPEGGGAALRPRQPAHAGLRDKPPLRVGLVVVTRYEPSARWRPRGLSSGQGVLALLDNTVPARRRPRQSLGALEAAVRTAEIVRSARGEAAAVAGQILDQAGAQSANHPRMGDPLSYRHS